MDRCMLQTRTMSFFDWNKMSASWLRGCVTGLWPSRIHRRVSWLQQMMTWVTWTVCFYLKAMNECDTAGKKDGTSAYRPVSFYGNETDSWGILSSVACDHRGLKKTLLNVTWMHGLYFSLYNHFVIILFHPPGHGRLNEGCFSEKTPFNGCKKIFTFTV